MLHVNEFPVTQQTDNEQTRQSFFFLPNKTLICGDIRPGYWIWVSELVRNWQGLFSQPSGPYRRFWCWGWFIPPGSGKGIFPWEIYFLTSRWKKGSSSLSTGWSCDFIHNNPGNQLTYGVAQFILQYNMLNTQGGNDPLCGSWLDRRASGFHFWMQCWLWAFHIMWLIYRGNLFCLDC